MTDTNEQRWREEFESDHWSSIERKWSFPLGSHHKKLVKETALNIYLAARKKAQEEIESYNIPKGDNAISIRFLLQGKEIEELKSFIKEATPWVKEIERMADVLGHSWENATRAWLEEAEKIK